MMMTLRRWNVGALKLSNKGVATMPPYLASDHLDVVRSHIDAREAASYVSVSELCDKIFGSPRLAELKLRWFDPTQAYCPERIDKGPGRGPHAEAGAVHSLPRAGERHAW